ncbi:tRNA preQ1(34) S-adenosylmethionine ribosyltransferase-isomerase QueA [Candidatus Uhrbacteria bacterium CG_4_9_14_3_um_filter_50_9]|uniref:S-adenosylmethionine:tRNA ribosyltransferase-isomerase n=1 Tax=Candidatus Uhrbacteria bacterium CG_4_9_14_3_um_filter_50_9 TaxID=1975035 RepID=A0A2M7XDK1_9BACT|nr:MAG: tRNA preQ1(34) S-adenosylmethionine ribosyltransferase-isomerase QueA [Candidatus Uhrbacteria bacterium CG_4_9_14_3_um_filter_50_9]
MRTDLFDYDLPEKLIAQYSVEPRDHSRLMVLDRETGRVEHKRFYEIVDELHEGDVLVMNNTKVFRARLRGGVGERKVEVFLLRERDGLWDVLMQPGRHVSVGDVVKIGDVRGEVVEKADVFRVKFDRPATDLVVFANAHGEIPIPPYVHEVPEHLDQYQTVYATEIGSVAAPTSGFHFTEELLERIRAKGVQIEYVTLHVGIGTFRPVKTDILEEHEMHAEFVAVSEKVAERINLAKQEGRRVIAVGTTTVRTLEGIAALHEGKLVGYSGDVNLFIKPGFEFHVIDALITNFHLPKSTLLVLVSAFVGREHVLSAYEQAVTETYRFFSFGDAMFVRYA